MPSIVTKTYENDVPAVTLQTVDIYCLFIFVHDMTYTSGLVLGKDITNMDHSNYQHGDTIYKAGHQDGGAPLSSVAV